MAWAKVEAVDVGKSVFGIYLEGRIKGHTMGLPKGGKGPHQG